jgi:hypothetical protein
MIYFKSKNIRFLLVNQAKFDKKLFAYYNWRSQCQQFLEKSTSATLFTNTAAHIPKASPNKWLLIWPHITRHSRMPNFVLLVQVTAIT